MLRSMLGRSDSVIFPSIDDQTRYHYPWVNSSWLIFRAMRMLLMRSLSILFMAISPAVVAGC
jgi:hypothetical protein